MAKRDIIYAETSYADTGYPSQDGMIRKICDICGEKMVVNNWPDGKSRTAVFMGFIVCSYCDPRRVEDHYKRENYRIMFPKRLRVIRLAQVTRALARYGCLKPMTDGPCKCAGCAAQKLFPSG